MEGRAGGQAGRQEKERKKIMKEPTIPSVAFQIQRENKGQKRTRCLKWEFGKMDIPLVTSYSTPVSRRESFLFFSRPGPSRLQKLSVEDSYLLGESDCHTFLWGPEDVSVKRGYTLPDRRVVSYTCVCVCVCVSLRVVLHPRGGNWSLKCSELPPLSGDNNPLSGGGEGPRPMFSCSSDGAPKRPCA